MYIVICYYEKTFMLVGKYKTFNKARTSMVNDFNVSTGGKYCINSTMNSIIGDGYEIGNDYAWAEEANNGMDIDYKIFKI